MVNEAGAIQIGHVRGGHLAVKFISVCGKDSSAGGTLHIESSYSPVSSKLPRLDYICRLHLRCNDHQPKSPWGEFGKVPRIGRFRTGFDFLIR
jgi:hypothetical protein